MGLASMYDSHINANEVKGFVRDSFRGHEDAFDLMFSKGQVLAFGGVPRDLLFFEKPTRDLDLVVTGLTNDSLAKIFSRILIRRTRFGGLQCLLKRKRFLDIWSLEETWAFKKRILSPTIENLPLSVFLTTDAVVVDLKTGRLIESNFITYTFEKRRIEIVLEENPFPALCVLRAFVHRNKYDLGLSDRLQHYIHDFVINSDDPISQVVAAQKAHYSHDILPKSQLSVELRHFSRRLKNVI